MPLPPNFNRWRHLLSTLMRAQNQIVRDYFREPNRDDEDLDISVSKESLRTACLLQTTDSAITALHRLSLFYLVMGQQRVQSDVYGIPISSFHDSVTFVPQVCLKFKEDAGDVDEDYYPLEAEISFRLNGETGYSYTEAKARSLAFKIKSEFGSGGGWRFRKGRLKFNYFDLNKGYRMSLLVTDEAEGRKVVEKVLSIQGDSFDEEKATKGELVKSPPVIPPAKSIMGETRRMPRKRPVGFVRFRRAELKIHGMRPDLVLVSIDGRRSGLV